MSIRSIKIPKLIKLQNCRENFETQHFLITHVTSPKIYNVITQPIFIGDDSDSDSHTSSTEDSPPGGARGPQKRPRKKPAPQVPRNVAIPVAMPKVPSVIPPRQPPPPRAIDAEPGN